jgi:hypothetical protein
LAQVHRRIAGLIVVPRAYPAINIAKPMLPIASTSMKVLMSITCPFLVGELTVQTVFF